MDLGLIETTGTKHGLQMGLRVNLKGLRGNPAGEEGEQDELGEP